MLVTTSSMRYGFWPAMLPALGICAANLLADVTDRARVGALPGEVAALHGAVDGLINAGIIQPFARIADLN
jgi:hypothetical protein